MVLIFKTDINEVSEENVRNILFSLKEINKIGFDFEDCDNILKVIANKNIVMDIETLLISEGFFCKELV